MLSVYFLSEVRLLTKIRKRRGPRIEPCDTQEITGVGKENSQQIGNDQLDVH